MTARFRPIVHHIGPMSAEGHRLAGGWCWFERVEVLERDRAPTVIAANDLPADALDALTAPRVPVAGVTLEAPRLMGVLNVTPDSFSDGSLFLESGAALSHARRMVADGAAFIDVGGESTRPGASDVDVALEIERTRPVIAAIAAELAAPISIDTRKSAVARAALEAGATLVNDVSAFNYDPQLAEITADAGVPVCLMHAQGAPATMQDDPTYSDVLLDVYDALEARVECAVRAGVARQNIIVDPGIGFGKTLEHNVALIRGIALFHGLGCAVMLGVSRKRFIGALGRAPDTGARVPGTIATTLSAIAQGVQIHRVHDIDNLRQALDLWAAATGLEQWA